MFHIIEYHAWYINWGELRFKGSLGIWQWVESDWFSHHLSNSGFIYLFFVVIVIVFILYYYLLLLFFYYLI